MNELVAVVEDEADIRAVVRAALRKAHLRVKEYADGKGFLASLRRNWPDLVVLDLMLPDADGLTICRSIREDRTLSTIPIIILTARAEETDRVLGLELGADDYLVKPFSPKELTARVKAVLRRSAPEAGATHLDAGDGLLVDANSHEASLGEHRLGLTQAEFRILQLLASRVDWVFSRDYILDHLWGDAKSVTNRSVDVHVKHLRDKLGTVGKRVVNVRGVGYKLVSTGTTGLDPKEEG